MTSEVFESTTYVSRPVLFAGNHAFRELPNVAGIHLGINSKGHIKPVLLDFINIPQSICCGPPDPQAPQAGE